MIKKIHFTFLACCIPVFMLAQINAVTEYGEQVLLMKDGTWKYQNEEDKIEEEIALNTKTFKKDKASNFLLKSSTFNVGLWLNTKEWKFNKATSNDDGEYELQLKKEDLYGTVITEKVEVPLEALREIAVINAKDVAPDTTIDNVEYRTVNGIKILMIEMSGTLTGIKFGYKGYYYSNENGTIQIILYSSKKLMKGYDDKIEKLLNGFVEL